ncbi:MAG TPA: hypothetical protein VGA61_09620 [Anaerolineae bacterium]
MRNPYLAGPYVTGRSYYGRQALIDYLLHGAGPAYWVVGSRRIGRTSLLRQLDLLAGQDGQWLPIFWDLQGCDSFKRLGQYFAAAVGERAEQFLGLDLTPEAIAHEDVLVLLPRLRRAARKAGREVLLLCDETEALVRIAQGAPRSMQRLHGELTAGNGLRLVAVSTPAIYALHDVCREWPTSSFLSGFDMAQMLGGLAPQDAYRLILQAQEAEPVRVAPDLIEKIRSHTNDHPYLIQLLCSRLFQESGRLRAVQDDDLAIDEGLAGLLAADFALLARADRRLLLAVAEGNRGDDAALARRLAMPPAELAQRTRNLLRLAYLRRSAGKLEPGNGFLAGWLAAEPDRAALPATRPIPVSEEAMHDALAGQQVQEANFLRTQLNLHRTRLVELEAIRARDLLQVAPQVLAEIEQHQYHIRHLLSATRESA